MEAQPLPKKTKLDTGSPEADGSVGGVPDRPNAQDASTTGMGDQSVTEAFNHRDMAEVDRAVAEAAEVTVKRSCTNSEAQDEEAGNPELCNVRPKLNFDESDDDGAMSYYSVDVQAAGGGENVAGHPLIIRNQRLGNKSAAIPTGYSNTRLVTKAELKR